MGKAGEGVGDAVLSFPCCLEPKTILKNSLLKKKNQSKPNRSVCAHARAREDGKGEDAE